MINNQNFKIDANLTMALSLTNREREISNELNTGFDNMSKDWRLIIKYGGDISTVCLKYNAIAEILTENFAIITIYEKYILQFSDEKEVEYIEKPKMISFQLNKSIRETCTSQVNDYENYNLKGDGVLIGIIDSGIHYRHNDFKNADGTSRIIGIWDQSSNGNAPAGFSYGTEYNNEQINYANSFKTIEESELIVPHYDYLGHGTHVTGIAAGNGAASNGFYRGVAPNSQIIVVKLGFPEYDSYPINTVDIMMALKYLINKAQSLNMPIAINLSYGFAMGSHDGHGLFETYINEMSMRWKSSIVVACGNEASKGHHTSGNTIDIDEVQFIVCESINNMSLEIWKLHTDFFNIEIINPRGVSTGMIRYQSNQIKYNIGNEKVLVTFGNPTPFSTKENIAIEIINENRTLSEGIWTIRFHMQAVLDGRYDIWMFSGQLSNNSCAFMHPTLNNTITVPSTTENVISVAGYNGLLGNISIFSGRGSDGNTFLKPDLAAPCENIISPYINCSYEALSGTSMAAPFVTGACALLLQWGIVLGNDPDLYGQKLKAYLCSGAKRESNVKYPNNIWGYGKLCLLNTLEILGGITQVMRSSSTRLDEEPETDEQKIISEDYVDIIVEKTNKLTELLATNPYVVKGYEYYINLAVIYVKESMLNEALKDLVVISSLTEPLLFGLLDIESLQESNILPVQNNPNLNLKGNGVLVGFIDTGIDYTHPAFLYEDGTTKIKALWDQTIFTNNPPEEFRYGTEYTEEQINEALKLDNPFELVPSTDENGHGTFLAGVVSGREQGKYLGIAPDSEIIFVKLAPAKKWARANCMLFDDNAVAYQNTDILLAEYYLIEKAKELGRPLSITFGVGTSQGAHDGSWYAYLTGSLRGVVMSSACGNEGNRRSHYRGKINNSYEIYEFELNVSEGEKGILMNIWSYAPDRFSIGLISPSGEIIEKISIKNTDFEKFSLLFFDTTVWVNYYQAVDNNGDQLTALRFKNPEHGIWKILIYGDRIIDGNFHAWLPIRSFIKEDTYFIDSNSSSTITEFGNSAEVISVGAYNHKDKHLFIESSRGPSRDNRIKPDIIAPGVRVSGPLPNNSYGVQSGTSVAAAHVAGAAALLLQWGIVNGNYPIMTTNVIRSLLIAGAKHQAGIKYPNMQHGYGELDLLNSFKEMNTIVFKDIFNFHLNKEQR